MDWYYESSFGRLTNDESEEIEFSKIPNHNNDAYLYAFEEPYENKHLYVQDNWINYMSQKRGDTYLTQALAGEYVFIAGSSYLPHELTQGLVGSSYLHQELAHGLVGSSYIPQELTQGLVGGTYIPQEIAYGLVGGTYITEKLAQEQQRELSIC